MVSMQREDPRSITSDHGQERSRAPPRDLVGIDLRAMSMSALRREGMRWRAVWSSSNEIDGKLGDDGRVTTDGGERREEGITGREDPRTR